MTCIPFSTFKKINPSSQIIIDGECIYGCLDPVSYKFQVYFTFESNINNVLWQILPNSNNFTLGTETSELTLLTTLFQNYTNVLYWKIDFNVYNQISTGSASLILKRNLLPTNGYCYVDKANGTSLSTFFNVICTNWVDLDGSISTYEYMGKIKFF